MDQEQLRRFAEVYRQMRDEQLAALLNEQNTLTDEARQALLDVAAERPDVPGIQQQAMEEARRQSERQAEREAKEARTDAQLAGARPTMGFWLGLLTAIVVAWPLWRALTTYSAIQAIDANGPHPFGTGVWLAVKVISVGIVASALAAAGVAIHAIHAGRTRRHLLRIVAMLWYISVGVFIIQSAVLRLLLVPFYEEPMLSAAPIAVSLIIHVIVASLRTAYLLRSRRCRLRYPKSPGESVLRVFE